MSGRWSFDDFVSAADHSMVVLTTAARGKRAGCLVGFHTQVSIDPFLYGLWISVKNQTHDVITAAAGCAVHLLGDADRDLAERFGGETGDQTQKFTGIAVQDIESTPGTDIPVLSGVAAMVGRQVDRFRGGGDHTLVVVAPVSLHGSLPPQVLRLSNADDIEPGHP